MEIRTTTSMTTNSLVKNMQLNQSSYSKLSEEVSSGNKILVPSDDPMAAIQILQDNTEISKLQGYNTNISTAQNEINVADGALTSIISSVEKAYDLSVQAANGTNGSADLSSIKAQVEQIVQNLKDLGNTKYNDTYIFGGTKTATPPFSDVTNAAGDVIGVEYSGSSSTGDYQRYTQISENDNVAINVSGDKVLGSYDGTTGTGVMKDMYDFISALNSGDATELKNSVGAMKNDIEVVTTSRTSLASLTNRLTSMTTANSNKINLVKEDRSGVQDTDMATALTDLYTSQTEYQASMSVVSNLLKLGTLWDYMS